MGLQAQHLLLDHRDVRLGEEQQEGPARRLDPPTAEGDLLQDSSPET